MALNGLDCVEVGVKTPLARSLMSERVSGLQNAL